MARSHLSIATIFSAALSIVFSSSAWGGPSAVRRVLERARATENTKQELVNTQKQLYRQYVNFIVDSFKIGESQGPGGETIRHLIDQETVANAIKKHNPSAPLEYDGDGRLIFDPAQHGLLGFTQGYGLYLSQGPEAVNAQPEGDRATLAVAHSRDVMIKNLVIRSHANLAEALKFSLNQNVVVDNVIIEGGYEDGIDIVRGKNYYFRDVVVKAGNGGRGATIKGGVSHVYFSESYFFGRPNVDCIEKISFLGLRVFSGACHFVEVGNFDDYSLLEEITNPKTGRKCEARPKTQHVYIDAEFGNDDSSSVRNCDDCSGQAFPVQVWPLADYNSVKTFGPHVFIPEKLRYKKWFVSHHFGDEVVKEWRKDTFDKNRPEKIPSLTERLATDITLDPDYEREFLSVPEGRWTNHGFFGGSYFENGQVYVAYNDIGWLQLNGPIDDRSRTHEGFFAPPLRFNGFKFENGVWYYNLRQTCAARDRYRRCQQQREDGDIYETIFDHSQSLIHSDIVGLSTLPKPEVGGQVEACSSQEYLRRRPDVLQHYRGRKRFPDTYEHWHNHGRNEGMCQPTHSETCTSAEYLERRPDVYNWYVDNGQQPNAREHWAKHGVFELMCEPH